MEEMAEDWENCCPLCMEEMDSTDKQLKPCRCGYQVCVWCWNHIMEMAEKDSTEGRCPACRTAYDKEKIVSTAVRLGEINDKKQKPGKAKIKAAEGRKNLSNVRVIQRNLVYVIGIPAALADEETLERKEYFGQYGKILKISVSKTGGHSSQHSSAMSSVSVYVTYVKEEDALRCIQSINGYALDGKILKACFGTTKYCNAWLKHMPCNNPDCLYLHDEGTREDSFTKEEMLAKYGSKNQHFHDLTHPSQRKSGIGLPPPVDSTLSSTSGVSQCVAQAGPTVVGSTPKAGPLVINLAKSSSLPAAASWGSRPSSSRLGSGRTACSPATKPKTGAGLINLSTASRSCASEQSLSNHDQTKHAKITNTDGAQASLSSAPRLLEGNHPAEENLVMIRTETFPSDVEDPLAGPSQAFDGLIPHEKHLNSAEVKGHVFKTTKDMKIADTNSFYKVADADEISAIVDTSAGTGFIRTSPTQDGCLKSPMGPSTLMSIETTSADQEAVGSESCGGFHLGSVDCNALLGLYADCELIPQNLGHVLQQEATTAAEAFSAPSKSHGFQNTCDATVSPPSNISNLNILLRQGHTSSEAHEDISCNKPSGDARSRSVHSVNIYEPTFYSQNQTTVQSGDSELFEKTVLKSQADDSDGIRKAPINGLSEHELISGIFSNGFDLWTDGNPQDLAQLLFDGKNVVSPAVTIRQEPATTNWKSSSGSKQSRFHFARQDEIIEQTFCSNELSLRSGYDKVFYSEKQTKQPSGNVLAGFTEVSVGQSSHLMNSKSAMIAPPGFSALRGSAIPPGFSQPKATDLRRLSEASQDPPQVVTPTSRFNHLEASSKLADVEFIDPAIMAVGKGKLPVGSRTPVPSTNSLLSAFLSQSGASSQQPKLTLDFEPSYEAHQDRSYRNYGYSSQDLDAPSSSLFHSSFNDPISQSRLMPQYHDSVLPHIAMQESVYTNGGHGAQKLRFLHSSSDDWIRLSEVTKAGQPSVTDAVGRLAMSQLSLDRVLQNRLEELSLSKDLSTKYYGDAAIPIGYDEQKQLSSARIGRYF